MTSMNFEPRTLPIQKLQGLESWRCFLEAHIHEILNIDLQKTKCSLFQMIRLLIIIKCKLSPVIVKKKPSGHRQPFFHAKTSVSSHKSYGPDMKVGIQCHIDNDQCPKIMVMTHNTVHESQMDKLTWQRFHYILS